MTDAVLIFLVTAGTAFFLAVARILYKCKINVCKCGCIEIDRVVSKESPGTSKRDSMISE